MNVVYIKKMKKWRSEIIGFRMENKVLICEICIFLKYEHNEYIIFLNNIQKAAKYLLIG